MSPSLLRTSSLFVAIALAGVVGTTAAQACPGVGVITRIDGKPQDIVIDRTEDGRNSVVPRPRVLEMICQGDSVSVSSDSSIVISIDGQGTVKVDRNSPYRVPVRAGAPSVAGNAYRALNEEVMPDMKRMAWNVRLKGPGDDFGFSLPTLSTGQQTVTARNRALIVRLIGGVAPYKVELRSASGALLATQMGESHEIVLPATSLPPGSYELTATDSTPRSLTATFKAVDQPAPLEASYSQMPDPEIRAAAAATSLARTSPGIWAFEAEQVLHEAPVNGLDRDRVYELVESYGDQ